MADPSGDKLYVELPASQTRKRLKGFGHGVRKVQSAGRGRSVIIHTATGQHLEELMVQFADVECSTMDTEVIRPREEAHEPVGSDDIRLDEPA
jgi:DNA transformation protein